MFIACGDLRTRTENSTGCWQTVNQDFVITASLSFSILSVGRCRIAGVTDAIAVVQRLETRRQKSTLEELCLDASGEQPIDPAHHRAGQHKRPTNCRGYHQMLPVFRPIY